MTAVDAVSPLSEAESFAFRRYEQEIDKGLHTFVVVGRALAHIRDSRLYREGYATFEGYCEQRWQLSRSRAYALMGAADLTDGMSRIQDTPLPVNEGQAAELRGLEPAVAAEVMQAAAESGPVTAKTIAKARKAIAPKPAKPARHACDLCDETFTRPVWHCESCGEHYDLGTASPVAVDTATGEVVDITTPATTEQRHDRAWAVALYPVLDVPGAPDDEVVRLAEAVLTRPEREREMRAENGGKWLAAYVRRGGPTTYEDPPELIAARDMEALSKAAVLLSRHHDELRDGWDAADGFTRSQWAGIVRSLSDHLAALQQHIDATPTLRTIK